MTREQFKRLPVVEQLKIIDQQGRIMLSYHIGVNEVRAYGLFDFAVMTLNTDVVVSFNGINEIVQSTKPSALAGMDAMVMHIDKCVEAEDYETAQDLQDWINYMAGQKNIL